MSGAVVVNSNELGGGLKLVEETVDTVRPVDDGVTHLGDASHAWASGAFDTLSLGGADLAGALSAIASDLEDVEGAVESLGTWKTTIDNRFSAAAADGVKTTAGGDQFTFANGLLTAFSAGSGGAALAKMVATSSQAVDVFDQILFGSTSYASGVTADLANSQFVIQETGIYEITAGIAFNFTGRAGLQLSVDSSTAYQVVGSILAGGCNVDMHTAFSLTAGDTLQLFGFTTEGTPPSTVIATGRAPWFAIKRIG